MSLINYFPAWYGGQTWKKEKKKKNQQKTNKQTKKKNISQGYGIPL